MSETHRHIRLAAILLATLCVLQAAPAAAADVPPWRLSGLEGLPARLALSGHQRIRYEALDGRFRSAFAGRDQLLALRTALKATVSLDGLALTAEVMDSRQALADDGTPLGTSHVNTLEMLQAHLSVDLGLRGRLLAGRHTMDLGSRRLVARNRFRNTINNFTGLNGTWTGRDGRTVRAFFVLPVDRLPAERARLRDNEVQIDSEDWDVRFWGVHAARPDVLADAAGELYLFGLHENDTPARATRDRRLLTVGGRLDRKPAAGRHDFEVEAALQFGESRASGAGTDVADLDHAAHFLHLAFGHTFDRAWTPRLVLQFDLASGDADPDDADNNRFDTLYGARRFEHGPTGIYGAFARANIVSPGWRVIARPRRGLNVMVAHRLYWLDEARDAWTTAGVRDASGDAGRFVGQQAEVRVRWEAQPGNLRLEGGAVRLFAGGFLEDAPNANGEGDAVYAYLQSVFTF